MKKSPEKSESKKSRLDIEICNRNTNISRATAGKMIKAGRIFVNSKCIKKSSNLVTNQDKITLKEDLTTAPEKNIWPFIKIIYNDKDLAVIHKPAGLSCHPQEDLSKMTLKNWLTETFSNNLSDLAGNNRPGIVHRLDKKTSGALIIAKNNATHAYLKDQFKTNKRSLKRIYLALVWGRPKPAKGTINASITRHPKQYQKMIISKQGKTATTHYKVLQYYELEMRTKQTCYISLISCKLETGRTHQIRLHLKEIGCPVIGDSLYFRHNKITKNIKQTTLKKLLENFKQNALHASQIGFKHPNKDQKILCFTPTPNPFKELIKELSSKNIRNPK